MSSEQPPDASSSASRKRTHTDSPAEGADQGRTAAAPSADDIVSIAEVYTQMCAQEEEARALLGGSDETHCTHDKGALARQMLYVCRTCSAQADRPIGVCVACEQNCHNGHDVLEIYTKRRFECDCATERATNDKCVMRPDSAERLHSNVDNSYAHNFDGLYCVCRRPYPDEDADDDEGDESPADCMLQCNHCEDWFHTKCLSTTRTPFTSGLVESIVELTCARCVAHVPLLTRVYNAVALPSNGEAAPSSVCVSACASSPSAAVPLILLWLHEYRSRLCACDECKVHHLQCTLTIVLQLLYTASAIDYLLDPADVLSAVTDEPSADTALMQSLAAAMPPTQLRVLAHEFHTMKEELVAYLATKPANHVVTAADIHTFFDALKAKRARAQEAEQSAVDNTPHTA